VQKTAIAVSYCKRGRGLIKINGVPIELVQPECLQYKVIRVSLHPGPCRRHCAARTLVATREGQTLRPLYRSLYAASDW
jgi:hypothetical protein